jgi:hypothetical protein
MTTHPSDDVEKYDRLAIIDPGAMIAPDAPCGEGIGLP